MISKKALLDLMANGALVITPNNRLSDELLSSYHRATNKSVLIKPFCQPYSLFLQTLYKRYCFQHPKENHLTLLSPEQVNLLWQRTLIEANQIIVNDGLIQAVHEAWTRCQQWLLDYSHALFTYTDQMKLFQEWVVLFLDTLSHLHVITEAQLVPFFCDTFPPAFLPKQLVWVCFDDFTPQQKQLQTFFEEHGVVQHYYDLEPITNVCYQFEASDHAEELDSLVMWATDKLNQGMQSIGIVLLDMESKGESLKRHFQKHFQASDFNVSLGQPLSAHPMVAHALIWLNLGVAEEALGFFDLSELKLLLHSPYLKGSRSELFARSQFAEDSLLVEKRRISKHSLLKCFQGSLPELASAIKELKDYPQVASPENWVIHFLERLKTLGFPGEYPLSSHLYQYYQRLMLIIEEFSHFNTLTSSMTAAEALTSLKRLIAHTIFQPQQITHAAIQVLGLLEASGCHFDALWIVGLTETHLPQPTRLSPFIPGQLQRQHHMPHATPERELMMAEKMIQRFLRASPEVIFSYARLEEDRFNRPSSFIRHLPSYPKETLNFSASYSTKVDLKKESCITLNLSPLVVYEETYLIPFLPQEKTQGGTAILSNQAKCPFKAFAKHRLHLKDPKKVSDGLTAAERGILIHRIMELIWRTLQNQVRLIRYTEDALASLIQDVIQETLTALAEKQEEPFSPIFEQIETKRLKRLVESALAFERQRPAFEIEALEKTFELNLSNLCLKLRIDRLDKLTSEDSHVLIDYKSTLPTALPWNETRPQESQLLLYTLLDESIKTLLFLELKEGQVRCKGLSEISWSEGGIKTIKSDENWDILREIWQAQLTAIATEFLSGQCPPKPINRSICQRCDYKSLCRYAF